MSELAVIVPVYRRPGNAAPFMESYWNSGAPGKVYAVADIDDAETIAAWRAAGATVLISERGHRFANKAQHGYLHTIEPWILLTGDDVRFHEGWYQKAREAAGDRFHMVATNDCGNPYVQEGRHALHPLVRRSWVDEHGCSWDGPGVIAHEGYEHAFCDNEWSAVALAAGVFVFCPESVVEHLHPVWGRGRWDNIYRKGMDAINRDGKLFHRRAKEFAS